MTQSNGVFTPLETNFIKESRKTNAAGDNKTYIHRYEQAVGHLMFGMICTRPDIAFTSSALGRFSHAPSYQHIQGSKRALCYLKQTSTCGLHFEPASSYMWSRPPVIQGFVDADFANDPSTARSTSGYVFLLGNTAISWKSQRQRSTARFTAEAEYIALADAAAEAIWLQGLYHQLVPLVSHQPLPLFCDNTAAITNARDTRTTHRLKHIDVGYHFTRDAVEQGLIILHHVKSSKNLADLMTKPLPKVTHGKHSLAMGIRCFEV